MSPTSYQTAPPRDAESTISRVNQSNHGDRRYDGQTRHICRYRRRRGLRSNHLVDRGRHHQFDVRRVRSTPRRRRSCSPLYYDEVVRRGVGEPARRGTGSRDQRRRAHRYRRRVRCHRRRSWWSRCHHFRDFSWQRRNSESRTTSWSARSGPTATDSPWRLLQIGRRRGCHF